METQARTLVSSKVVLVVDDEPLLRMLAADFLTDAGFEVVEASSADEAVVVLESRDDISMLFSDVQMPGSMDGVGLAAITARRWPSIRLLLTSGNRSPNARPLPKQVMFLAKPYNLPAVATIARAA